MMRPFKDSEGRVWELDVNVAQLRRVKADAGVDLMGLVEDAGRPLMALVNDPAKLVDVLFVLCRKQAAADGVTDEQFGEGLAGDALARAADAFVEGLIDFFPDPNRRKALRAAWAVGRDAGAELARRAAEEADALTVEAVLGRLGTTSGGAPDSAASTPTPSPSGS